MFTSFEFDRFYPDNPAIDRTPGDMDHLDVGLYWSLVCPL